MSDQLSNDLLIRLEQTLRSAGKDTSRLQDGNPYDPQFDTAGGRETRMIVEGLNPQLAVDLQSVSPAGRRQSLGYRAAIARGERPEEFTGALASEYQAANPQLMQQQAEKAYQDKLAELEQEADAKRLANTARQFGGDLNAAKRAMDADQQRETERQQQAERDAKSAKALDARIAAKQLQIRQAAQIAMGNTVIPD